MVTAAFLVGSRDASFEISPAEDWRRRRHLRQPLYG